MLSGTPRFGVPSNAAEGTLRLVRQGAANRFLLVLNKKCCTKSKSCAVNSFS